MELVSNDELTGEGRLLTFRCEQTLGFVGGQFLIIDTGLKKENGDPLKRCFTIVSSDAVQQEISIAVLSVGQGSQALHGFEPGQAVGYSGPWGKLVAEPCENEGAAWIVASDTGITAATALVRSRGFSKRIHETVLIWFTDESRSVLTQDFVRESLPSGLGCYEYVPVPAVGTSERLGVARSRIADLVPGFSPPAAMWLAGDGELLYPLRDEISRTTGAPTSERTFIECFFNRPERS